MNSPGYLNLTKSKSGSKKRSLDSSDVSDFEVSDFSLYPSPTKKLKGKDSVSGEIRSNDKLLLELAMDRLEKCASVCKKTYATQLKELDFSDLSDKLGFSSSVECEARLKKLLSKTVKVKCLYQLLQEASYLLPYRMGVKSAFVHFMSENESAISDKKKQLGVTKMEAASALWSELTDQERARYDCEEDGCQENDVGNGKTPFEFFVERLKKKKSEISIVDARRLWSELKPTKKNKFIERSLKIQMILERNEATLNETHCSTKQDPKIKGPTKDEVLQYLKSKEVPEMPAKTPPLYYYKEKFLTENEHPPNILLLSVKAFKNLPNKKQMKWNDKFKQAWQEYEKQVTSWKGGQSEVTCYIYDKLTKKKSPKEKKLNKLNDIKDNFQKIEMPINSAIKFYDEPKVPPMTPLQIYAEQFDDDEKSSAKITEEFNALDKAEKNVLKEKSEIIRKKFQHDVIKFAKSLTDDKLRLFLGIRRIRYANIFKCDIFGEIWPDADYPVYTKRINPDSDNKVKIPKAEPIKIKPKIKKNSESSSEQSDEENKSKLKKLQKHQKSSHPAQKSSKSANLQQKSSKTVKKKAFSESDVSDDDQLEAWAKSTSLAMGSGSSSSEEDSD